MNTTKNSLRIKEISKELGLSHIGSNLSVLPILEEIYEEKKPKDKVILDNAHAHLAHLVVKHIFDDYIKGEITAYGIHCDRLDACHASGGSLGHGIGIGIGYAIVNPQITVYIIVSDGSMQEGSNWEALRLIDSLKVKNIRIYCNFNGYSAVDEVDFYTLKIRMQFFCKYIEFRNTDNTLDYAGVEGHYKKAE